MGLHQRPDARWKIKCVRSPAELWWCVCRYAAEEAAAAPDSLIGLRYPASRTVCRSALRRPPMPGIAPSPVPYAMGISFRWPHQNDSGQAARHHLVKGGVKKRVTVCPPSRRGGRPVQPRAHLKGGIPTTVIRHPLGMILFLTLFWLFNVVFCSWGFFHVGLGASSRQSVG